MKPFRPLLIASLPASTVEDAARQIELARRAGADLAELRLDRWDPTERAGVGRLFPGSLPLIVTVRSHAEGGAGPDRAAEREPIWTALAKEPFAYLDLEAARDRPMEGVARDCGRGVIRSAHLPNECSLSDLRERLADPPEAPGILKVVLPATFLAAVDDLRPLVSALPDPRPVLLTTGASGSLWRAWARELRLPWVYCTLPAKDSVGSVEPSQLPVDQMVRWFSAADAPLFAVVGHPVAHSLSPSIHNDWMVRAGRSGLYLALDLVSPEEFRRAVELLPGEGYRGLNVTHPWKRLAYECAGTRSTDALACGTANCLRFDEGTVSAENTDLGAIFRRLSELRDSGHWDGSSLAVLGGGGAARATLAAAQRLGSRASVFTRRTAVATSLAAEYDARIGTEPGPTSLIVQATGVGREESGPMELPFRSLLSPRSYVLDWVYSPEDPYVATTARAAGARYEDGRRLLVYQAAASYRVWWGDGPDRESVESVVKELTCAA